MKKEKKTAYDVVRIVKNACEAADVCCLAGYKEIFGKLNESLREEKESIVIDEFSLPLYALVNVIEDIILETGVYYDSWSDQVLVGMPATKEILEAIPRYLDCYAESRSGYNQGLIQRRD